MKIEIKDYVDKWQVVKDTTMTTVGMDKGKYPTSEWKTKLLKSEHSPIRNIVITVKFYDIPYWVVGHFVRHKFGIEHFVSTQRTDRNKDDIPRDQKPQGSLVDYQFTANAQAIINISRKRLCTGASKETREAWRMFLEVMKEYEPELYNLCVRECVYRCRCTEMFPCGIDKTDGHIKKVDAYHEYNGE